MEADFTRQYGIRLLDVWNDDSFTWRFFWTHVAGLDANSTFVLVMNPHGEQANVIDGNADSSAVERLMLSLGVAKKV